MAEWTRADWEDWQAMNRKLLSDGWLLTMAIMDDGSVEEYAEKDGVRINRTPVPWRKDLYHA